MKIVFHKRFYEVYTADPAAAPGRMEAIVRQLEGEFEFLEPLPASEREVERIHGRSHIQSIKQDNTLYEIGLLAVGGAIAAAETALRGEPSFGLIRPPGHHASPHSCWGFCYFNNIAIALMKLIGRGEIQKAFILDFDLHYGDGTANCFSGSNDVFYSHPEGSNRDLYLKTLQSALLSERKYDLLAVSAGFDRHEDDWGGMLKTEDYFQIGQWVKASSRKNCQGRRFGVLEGGYEHAVLGKNVKSFLQGLMD